MIPMIDIYNEIGYIKNVLSQGLSQKWERDAILLTRFYKMEGCKKQEAKDKIREHCELASTRKDDPIYFNRLISYKRLNQIVDGAWKKEDQLREIKYVETSQEVIDWFLGLEDSFTVDAEFLEKEKIKRPGVKIKDGKALNWQRVKYLFTLYIWTKIQENYLDRPNMHYLKQYNKRFKEDADLKAGFNLQKERDYLYDLGLININYAIGIDAKFIEDYDVFKTPITDKNRVRIYSDDPPDGELYHPGYWLEKQKMGTFVCEECGGEFAHYNKGKNECKRKYCKECAEKKKNGIKNPDTWISKNYRYCIDCKNRYEVEIFDHSSKRCPECQKKHNNYLASLRMKRLRECKNVDKVNKKEQDKEKQGLDTE